MPTQAVSWRCRSGVLYPDKAQELGARPGKAFAKLKAGEDFTTPDGVTIRSADVRASRPQPVPAPLSYPELCA